MEFVGRLWEISEAASSFFLFVFCIVSWHQRQALLLTRHTLNEVHCLPVSQFLISFFPLLLFFFFCLFAHLFVAVTNSAALDCLEVTP